MAARRVVGPLLTSQVNEALLSARRSGTKSVECSLDLDLSATTVGLEPDAWTWQGGRFPYLQACKDRTIYYWTGENFLPASRFRNSLIKLVPTEWGPPTFEIDGIKMLPTAEMSPYEDARRKVTLIQPSGRTVLDTCGGLGYFAAWCIRGQAAKVLSYEKNPDVLWLRSLNPWSPEPDEALSLTEGDITEEIRRLPDASVDSILHDPPRFGIAGELYSQAFYDELARVIRRRGRLFHYTGSPNMLTTGRDLPREVSKRLSNSGFTAQPYADGVLATRK